MPTRSSRPIIAFFGLGAMGTPMASRLLAAGYAVHAWNRSASALDALVALGAEAATTPRDAAASADVVVTMLPDGAVVQDVMTGALGALASLRPRTTWLQMSSIGVEWTSRLGALAATSDVLFVDAPVSGSTGPATDGTLIVLASGPEETKDVAGPIFEVLGQRTAWLGAAGAGSKAKLVLNNWLVDLVEMTVETLRFSDALGLDPREVIDLLAEAPIGSPYAVAEARAMLEGDFTTNFALKHAVKDATLSLEAARAANLDLVLTDSLLPLWQRALDAGDGDEDLSVVYRTERSEGPSTSSVGRRSDYRPR